MDLLRVVDNSFNIRVYFAVVSVIHVLCNGLLSSDTSRRQRRRSRGWWRSQRWGRKRWIRWSNTIALSQSHEFYSVLDNQNKFWYHQFCQRLQCYSIHLIAYKQFKHEMHGERDKGCMQVLHAAEVPNNKNYRTKWLQIYRTYQSYQWWHHNITVQKRMSVFWQAYISSLQCI